MVQLFIPEGLGESQHVIMRRPEGVPITTPNLIASPWVGTLVAMGWTGLLALGGRLRPGTFVKSAAIFSVLNFSWEAAGTDVNEQAERAQPIGLLSQLSGGQQLARLARIG
ncbi:hypothetical protein PtrV1_10298 [Pyrenophora tritici-repentis]|nr:hypothetical protein PtrV1_10298 [Pyrenophora tritici-repentis]